MAVVCDNYVKSKNAICGPDAVLWNNPDGRMYRNCCALKGLVKVRRHGFFPYRIVLKSIWLDAFQCPAAARVTVWLV